VLLLQPRKLIAFLHVIEKLKCNTRHSWTSSGRQESVAEHSWRLAVMALLVAGEFPEVDGEKLVKMCLIHDFGEALTGDVPSFAKTKADEEKEEIAILKLLEALPEHLALEFRALFNEMAELHTEEAKLFKALDKLEAVLSHNEASLDTWLPLEYTENLTYGTDTVAYSEYLRRIREELKRDTIEKIECTPRAE